MTWFNEEYRRRQIVGINATGGTGISGTIDVSFLVPADWDDFWDNIRSDFKDVVVTDSQGRLVQFRRKSGANYSTRTLTLQVDGLNIKNDDSFCVVYLYFFNPDETSDQSDTVTIDSPKTGYIMLSAPHSRIVSQASTSSALDTPVQSFVKSSVDEVHVFFVINQNFAKRFAPYNERNDEEGIEYIDVKSYDDSGTDSTERYDIRDTRIGNGFVRASFKAGTDGDSYAIAIQVYTTLGQLFEIRAILRVIDLLP